VKACPEKLDGLGRGPFPIKNTRHIMNGRKKGNALLQAAEPNGRFFFGGGGGVFAGRRGKTGMLGWRPPVIKGEVIIAKKAKSRGRARGVCKSNEGGGGGGFQEEKKRGRKRGSF